MLKKKFKQIYNRTLLLFGRRLPFLPFDPWVKRSWSQEGEDLILLRFFEHQKRGFYVDVGAHHPKRFSNTYLFYKRGWRGINIDAMPGSMAFFNEIRSEDINLEIGIACKAACLDYYIFNEPALNGFEHYLAKKRHNSDTEHRIESVINISVLPLSEVLDLHLPNGQAIDFLTIDAEGFDLEVLKSNDWQKYRPKFVLTEILGSGLHDVNQSEIGIYMKEIGYYLYAKSINTVFFKESDSI